MEKLYQKIEAIRVGCAQSIGGCLEFRTLWHVGRRTSWAWDSYAVDREELAKRRLVVGERKRRDSELHLVGKCSETLPSNIETRTRCYLRARPTLNVTRGISTSASYLCKRQFPGALPLRVCLYFRHFVNITVVFTWHIPSSPFSSAFVFSRDWTTFHLHPRVIPFE